MAITTPYKSGTVSSVSGTTFTASASTFTSVDVGRIIILTNGSGKLQHRKITGYISATAVTVNHAWDATPWLSTVADVAPSNGDAFAVSYVQGDAAFTGEAGVTVSGEQIDISALTVIDNAYVHITNAQVDLDSAGVEIGTQGGLIFGWYEYIAGEDAQVRDSCHIIDRTTSGIFGTQMAVSDGDFGMLDIYGGNIVRDGEKLSFWRCYNNTSASDCQNRWINVQTFGDKGLGCRVDGNRSILIIEQVGADTDYGVANTRSAVSRVEISAIDCAQAGYVWTDSTNGGPNGRLIFNRLNGISDKIITVSTISGNEGLMEIIARKSEVDSAPVMIEVQASSTTGTHTFRYGNLVKPTFVDASSVLITDSIKTDLLDTNSTSVNTETITDGMYTEYFARHTDIDTYSYKGTTANLSDGTLYAPYLLNAIAYERVMLSQSLNIEKEFNSALTIINDTLITQTTKATVDAYTTLNNANEVYDRAKAYLYDNFAGEGQVLIGRDGLRLNFDTGLSTALVVDSTASVIGYSVTTLTVKSSTFTGGATGTGTVTIQGATTIQNARYECDVNYSSTSTELDNITCTGALDFSIAGTYELDGCTINEVTNSSGGSVTLNLNNSTITTNTGPNITIGNIDIPTVKTFTNLTNANVQINQGTTVLQRSTGLTGSVSYDATGETGMISYCINRAGYAPVVGMFNALNETGDVYGALTQKKQPNGDVSYTGSTSLLLTCTALADGSRAYLRIGDGSVNLTAAYSEFEDILQTQDGMSYLMNGGGEVSYVSLPTGAFLFIGDNVRLIRDNAGDTGATIEAFVQSTEGIPLDGTNGSVNFFSVTEAQQLAEYNGFLWVDAANGTDGGTYPFGAQANPCKTAQNIADLITDTGIRDVAVFGELTLNVALTGDRFFGRSFDAKINLNGQNIESDSFQTLTVAGTGVFGIGATFINCYLDSIVGFVGEANQCRFLNTLSIGAGDATFPFCSSAVAGLGRPTVTLTDASSQVDFRPYTGGLIIDGMVAGNNVSVDMISGALRLLNTCTGGDVVIRGDQTLDDQSAGTSVSDLTTNTLIQANLDAPISGIPTIVPTATENADAVWNKTLP